MILKKKMNTIRIVTGTTGAAIVDFGTKWKNMPGTRDQMIKFGWDQGPNGKNWLGPGTIGPPHSESQYFRF